MLELEIGEVKHYNDQPGKRFGFLAVLDEDGNRTGEEIFFHANDGQWVDAVADDIEFVGKTLEGAHIYNYPPKVGDKLAFDRREGKEGKDKAAPWTFAEGYTNRLKKLTAPYYCLVRVVSGGDIGEVKDVVWQCQGSDELSGEFPLRVLGDVLIDPLAPSTDPNTGVTTSYIFKVWVEPDMVDGPGGESARWETGYWRDCHDPRHRSAAVLELEAAAKV